MKESPALIEKDGVTFFISTVGEGGLVGHGFSTVSAD